MLVEDERASARNLKQILEDLGNVEVIDHLDTIEDTVDWFRENDPPDVLFLDIHLADGSAFEIFKQIEVSCPIIFTTAYDEYAIKAFRVNSISYLLKPIKRKDVEEALNKLERLWGSSQGDEANVRELLKMLRPERNYKSHFLVSVRGDKLMPLETREIGCIHIADGLVRAFTYDGQKYFLDQTMDEVEASLDPQHFYRANRQTIIARQAIRDLDSWLNHRLKVNLKMPFDEDILISKAKVKEFKEWIA